MSSFGRHARSFHVRIDVGRVRIAASIVLLMLCNVAMATTATVVVTDKNSGQAIPIAVGQSLEVRLPSNPTTGYRWTAGTLSSTSSLRQKRAPAFVSSKSGLLGAGGTQVFSYDAVAAGTAPLSFSYSRPWEHGPPARRIDFTVVVHASGK